MPQYWLNHFSEPLTAGLSAGEIGALPLAPAVLNKLAALLPGSNDWALLTLSSEDGSGAPEVIRYQPNATTSSPVRRGYEGTIAQLWPAGSLCSCMATAEAMGNFEVARDLQQQSTASTLSIGGADQRVSTWYWAPSATGELTLAIEGYGSIPGEAPLPRVLVELWPTGTGALVLHLPDLYDAGFSVPAGTTGVNEDGSYTLTIPESPRGCYVIEITLHGVPIVKIENYAGLTAY